MRPNVIAWNGSRYALVTQGGQAMLVSPNGQMSTKTDIADLTYSPSAMASDGNGFLLAGPEMDCQFLLCFPIGVRGTRLGPDLQRIDAQDLAFIGDTGYGNLMGVAWNGSAYVVAAQDHNSDHLLRIPASPSSPINISTFAGATFGQSMTITKDGRIAIAGFSEDGIRPATTRVLFLSAGGSVQQTIDLERRSGDALALRIEPLPDGGVAYLSSSVQDVAPHHGTSHVMMALARPSIPTPPAAPHVVARLQNNKIVVDWSASAGTINGYRLEYRVDDGSWNELEDWFFPAASHTSITQPASGGRFAIRMRAFNDGGAGAYSATAIANPIRRRAVR
jgi:hypothetical protein